MKTEIERALRSTGITGLALIIGGLVITRSSSSEGYIWGLGYLAGLLFATGTWAFQKTGLTIAQVLGFKQSISNRKLEP